VVRRFVVARLKAVRDYEAGFFEGGDRDALGFNTDQYTSIADPAVYQQMSFSEMAPNGQVNADSLEELQLWCVAHGYFPG
jgi:hypothetical protein